MRRLGGHRVRSWRAGNPSTEARTAPRVPGIDPTSWSSAAARWPVSVDAAQPERGATVDGAAMGAGGASDAASGRPAGASLTVSIRRAIGRILSQLERIPALRADSCDGRRATDQVGAPVPGTGAPPCRGGRRGIRTHGGPEDLNSFRDCPIRPLWQPSVREAIGGRRSRLRRICGRSRSAGYAQVVSSAGATRFTRYSSTMSFTHWLTP